MNNDDYHAGFENGYSEGYTAGSDQQVATMFERDLCRAVIRQALRYLESEQPTLNEDCGTPTCVECATRRRRQVVIDALRKALVENDIPTLNHPE